MKDTLLTTTVRKSDKGEENILLVRTLTLALSIISSSLFSLLLNDYLNKYKQFGIIIIFISIFVISFLLIFKYHTI